jgi:hypothetical protein
MEVEIYIGYGYNAGSWGTVYVTVPDILRGHKILINDFIDSWMSEHANDYKNEGEFIAFWGIYNIPAIGDYED